MLANPVMPGSGFEANEKEPRINQNRLKVMSEWKVMNRLILMLVGLSLVTCLQTAVGQTLPANQNKNMQQIEEVPDEESPIGYVNWKLKTMGGQQFWTDVRYAGGWRVQRNSETEHCRLLDPLNVRNAWGNQLHCNQILDGMIEKGKATTCKGKVVIILHGLIRTSNSMQPLAGYLQDQGSLTTINLGYASTREGIGEHAAALKQVIGSLGPEVTEINFVGHSLGNIVIRRYLADTTDTQTGTQGDPRIRRIVMLAPPNQGSRVARMLKNSFLFHTIAGVSGGELSTGWEAVEPTLATPSSEFGIIAGGQETNDDFSNFVLRGKDDFTVSVDETKLPGADDFLVRPWFHSTIMKQPDVLNAVLSFIQNGYFISEKSRVRIADASKTSEEDRLDATTDKRIR